MDRKPPISIHIELSEEEFTVEILDRGKSFDRTKYRAPTFPEHWDQGNTRGVGVYLMYQCMDDVEFGTTKAKTNQLRMVKKRPHSIA